MEGLPREILALTFSFLNDPLDAMSVHSACRFFWSLRMTDPGFVGTRDTVMANPLKTWRYFLRHFAAVGNVKGTLLALRKGADNLDDAICAAASGGHRAVIDVIVEEAGGRTIDWDVGLLGAAEAGDGALIDFFLERGASKWHYGIEGAARANRRDWIAFFSKESLDCGLYCYSDGEAPRVAPVELLEQRDLLFKVRGASFGGHWDLIFDTPRGNIPYTITVQESNFFLPAVTVEAAAECRRMNVIEEVLSDSESEQCIARVAKSGMTGAARGGHADLVAFFREKGANNFVDAAKAARDSGHEDLALFLEHGRTQEKRVDSECILA